ncbi:YkvA family protein [Phenylobacterium aquaticum]|uniref:YkvA family protein n=1 Tax=Phenylobacterium aquaticum TaxID=1763816 RepID=UPI001F5DCF04|nr:YkvA family protein [Phenylobacterium aquaticum]MCI3133185.1 YkvA family protein [Phenylobacterium aquaticum]
MSAAPKDSRHVKGGGFDPAEVIDPSKALIPSVVQVNERRVAAGFWPKIRKVATKIPFAPDLLSVWYCARDPETPVAAKGLMMAALAYFVLPTDALPDFLGVIGFTDDAAVLAAVVALVGKNLKPAHRQAAEALLAKLGGDA